VPRRMLFLMTAMLLTLGWVLAQGGDPNTLTVALSGNVETMDPHTASSRAVPFLENVYEPLIGLQGPTTELSPVLAERVEVSDDQTVYTFHLRPGVVFHDGTPLDAAAVAYTFDRVRGINKGPYWAVGYLETIEQVDDLTVRMTIRPGGPPFLQAVSMVGIVSPTAFQAGAKDGDAWAEDWAATNTAGTGPYVLAELVRGDRFVLEKFDPYWGGWDKPHFTRSVMLLIPERSTAQLMLERGEVDIAEQVPTEALPALRADPDVTVIERDSGVRVLYLMLNAAAGPTADVRVRQAINLAFDQATFLQATGGAFTTSNGPVPAEFLDGYEPEIPYNRVDLDEAQRLLEEAGQAGMTLDVYYTTGDQVQELAGQVLQAMLGQIGVTVNVIAQDFPAFVRSITAWGTGERSVDDENFRMANFLYTPPRMPDAYAYLWYMYHSDAQGGLGRNQNFYFNPEVDALIEAGALATDPEERIARYREAVDAIVADAPQVFVGTQKMIYTLRSDVGGFYMHPTWFPAVRVYPLHREN
jgi:peptide/nickel transport system substrate-binding protein